jgi:hypothetical protein
MGASGKEQDHYLKINLLHFRLRKMEIIKTLRSAQPHCKEMVGQPGGCNQSTAESVVQLGAMGRRGAPHSFT